MRWGTYVAIGDSFTEGVGDPLPDGSMRGWADLVAAGLGARYANLAVRGRRLKEIASGQVAPALALAPDLVSLTAGGNDALRPGFDLDAVMEGFEEAVERLAEEADVLLFRFPDLSLRLPFPQVLRRRITGMNEAISDLAARHGALVTDLSDDPALDSPALWLDDRIHLNPAGHRHVAARVLNTLTGAPAPPPERPAGPFDRSGWRWAAGHLGPWLGRRLRGGSSGDGRAAKRPVPL
ncbi:SGNH/GDSL hydrolase family protein [Actinocorallia populi]|uniref:SGNH/GDSL hydrolase family protein n=1 Tax=Actinocorallia populi TaxID=2079200 RepID=UPI000D089A67|nr:SGNH/GDSL hydrolase family protein [Actinocorallia populi]